MATLANRNPKILIVEDDQSLSDQLSGLLASRGYHVVQRYEGHQALTAAMWQRLHLILLDVLLPRMNGFEFLEKLRKTRQTPVMMLTACGAEQERIMGYQQGADDYVPKPFSFTELLLRIEALLRRTLGESDQRADPATLSAGELKLDRHAMTVSVQGNPVALTPIQFRLLWILVLHQSEPLSKPYLYQVVLRSEEHT